jgi:leucyl aminopeptidase
MADAFKLVFSSIAAPRTGVLVVFCDDSLRLGAATRRVLGRAVDQVEEAAKAFGPAGGCIGLTILDGFSTGLPWGSHFVD